MKRLAKRIGIGLLLVAVGIQFIRPARNESGQVLPTDITHVVVVPPAVELVLKVACYDCHSNNTSYPWYINVQPAAWFMEHHVQEGKRALNFSDFGSYSRRRQAGKFKSIASQVRDGEMPIASYTRMHPDARLSKEQQDLVIEWARRSADSLSKTE